MEPLTDRQNQIYQFVQQQIQSKGFPPTVREIAKHFRVFPKAIQDHLAALERKGSSSPPTHRLRPHSKADSTCR
jgi:repressor LexA